MNMAGHMCLLSLLSLMDWSTPCIVLNTSGQHCIFGVTRHIMCGSIHACIMHSMGLCLTRCHSFWSRCLLHIRFAGSSIIGHLSVCMCTCLIANTYSTNALAFGTLYASQFTLIHCEFSHPWDALFAMIGIGTAMDHNVHHALVTSNYGHFFMWYDWVFGTYKSGTMCSKMRLSHLQDDVVNVSKWTYFSNGQTHTKISLKLFVHTGLIDCNVMYAMNCLLVIEVEIVTTMGLINASVFGVYWRLFLNTQTFQLKTDCINAWTSFLIGHNVKLWTNRRLQAKASPLNSEMIW